MKIPKTVSLVLMWVFLIGMYIFKTTDLDMEASPAMAASTYQLETEEADAKDKAEKILYKYKVLDLHNKLEHKHDHERTVKIITSDNDNVNVIRLNGDVIKLEKELKEKKGNAFVFSTDAKKNVVWKAKEGKAIWTSDDGDIKVLSTDGMEIKTSVLKAKDLAKKLKLEIKEQAKGVAVIKSTTEDGSRVITIQSSKNKDN